MEKNKISVKDMLRRLLMAIVLLAASSSICMSQDSKYELEFSLGFKIEDPAFRSSIKSLVNRRFTGDCADKYYFDNHSGGISLNAAFLYNINKTLSIGGVVGTYNIGETVSYKIPDYKTEVEMMDADISVYFVMPQVAFSWYKLKYVTLYSKVAAGLKYQHATYDLDEHDIKEDKLRMAYEVLPIGIKLGRSQFKAFMELGYGVQGYATLGLSVLLK